MSYLTQGQDPAARAKGILGVVAAHAAIGLVVVTGLTVSGVIEPDAKRTPITIFTPEPDPTPPPPTPTPTQTEVTPQPAAAPPPAAPPSAIDLSPPTRIEVAPLGPVTPDPVRIPAPLTGPVTPPSPTPPPAAFTPTNPRPLNGPAGWIRNEDYPRRALTRGWEGPLSYRLTVGSDGRVDNCTVTSSSGRDVLDQTACRLIERRARFEPAMDRNGAETVGTFSGEVAWRIPE